MAAIELVLLRDIIRDATGLIHGLRVRCDNRWAKLDCWLWLDRETGQIAELRPYRIGMRLQEPRR